METRVKQLTTSPVKMVDAIYMINKVTAELDKLNVPLKVHRVSNWSPRPPQSKAAAGPSGRKRYENSLKWYPKLQLNIYI